MSLFERMRLDEMRKDDPRALSQRNIGRMMQRVRSQAVRTYKKGTPLPPPSGEDPKTRSKMKHDREMGAQSRIAKLMAPAQWEAYKNRVTDGDTHLKQMRGRRVHRKHYRRVHGDKPQDIFQAKIQGR